MSQISFLFTATVNEGQLAALEGAAKEGVKALAENEPGCLGHDWSVSDDGKELYIYEVYKDNEACLAHFKNMTPESVEGFMKLVTPTGLRVWGEPNDAVRGAMADFKPVFHRGIAKLER